MFFWGLSYRLIELRWDCLNLVHKSHLPNCDVFMYLKIIFTLTCLTNSVDPGEMQHFVVLHLGLQCFSKYSFRSQWSIFKYPLYCKTAAQEEKLFLARPN